MGGNKPHRAGPNAIDLGTSSRYMRKFKELAPPSDVRLGHLPIQTSRPPSRGKKNVGRRNRPDSVFVDAKQTPFSTSDGVTNWENAVQRIKTIPLATLEERASTSGAGRADDVEAAASSCSPMYPGPAIVAKGREGSRSVIIFKKPKSSHTRGRPTTFDPDDYYLPPEQLSRKHVCVWPFLCGGDCKTPIVFWPKSGLWVFPIE